MDLADLSPEDLALVMAFAEIAKQECADRPWAELEPALASCWEDNHRQATSPTWADIARYIRDVCEGQ